MKILLQPCASKAAKEHYDKTMRRDGESAWGMTESLRNRSVWKRLEAGDVIVFYAEKEFFCVGKISRTQDSVEVATRLWGTREDGKTWNLMYFIVNWQEIRISYNPGILKTIDGRTYSDKHAIQGTQILEGQNAIALQDYLSANTDDILPFEEPSETEKIPLLDDLFESIDDKRSLEQKLESISTKDFRERFSTREIKLMVRDPRLARIAKEREKYVCQICRALPFVQKGGDEKFYAEAHHVMELSKGGADLLDNMWCVCPTCHRVLHYGTDEALEARKALRKLK